MPKIYMVAGLGFGDEGKGTIVDYLTDREKAHTVVRYNGGAQAAHNVVLADGKHHTFSQFGSGTFSGAATHLSRFMIIDPMALKKEAEGLRELGISNPFDLLTVERGAPLITPYQKGANRLREFLRSPSGRHGSCGVGVGETMSDYLTHGEAVPKIEDLFNPVVLGEKLSFIRELKLKEFSRRNLTVDAAKSVLDAFNLLTVPVKKVLELWNEVTIRLVDREYLQDIDRQETIIFEGAQGMLLDQTWGFHPHTTWTDITFNNADTILDDLNFDREVEKIGVLRTYLTRHGAGPFPTEFRAAEGVGHYLEEKFNKTHAWQGKFRMGYFDMMLLKYSLDAIRPIHSLALTHVDALPHLDKMCISYDPSSTGLSKFYGDDRLLKLDHEDLDYQRTLGGALQSHNVRCNYWPVNHDFVDIIEDMAEIGISILSNGPTRQDKLKL